MREGRVELRDCNSRGYFALMVPLLDRRKGNARTEPAVTMMARRTVDRPSKQREFRGAPDARCCRNNAERRTKSSSGVPEEASFRRLLHWAFPLQQKNENAELGRILVSTADSIASCCDHGTANLPKARFVPGTLSQSVIMRLLEISTGLWPFGGKFA